MTTPNAPPPPEWPPHLVAFLKASVWNKMLNDHDGPEGVLLWLTSGKIDPATGERIPFAPSVDFVYPIALSMADHWWAKRQGGSADPSDPPREPGRPD